MIFVVALYAIFAGMAFINASLMASDPYPIIVGMFRSLGSGVIILGYFLLFDKAKILGLKLTKHQWYLLTMYGILIHAFAMCGFSYGVLYASPISICFLYAAAPFLTAILLYFDQGQSLSKAKMIGLTGGFIGLLPILFKSGAMDHSVIIPGHVWLGNAIIFISMIFFCYGWILFKKLIGNGNYSTQVLNGIAMIMGGFVIGLAQFVFGGKQAFLLPYSYDFGYLLSLFVLSSLLTYSLYAYLLNHFSPTFISFAGFLEPAFAMLYGVIIFGYNIDSVDIISFIILFLGLYIFYRQEL